MNKHANIFATCSLLFIFQASYSQTITGKITTQQNQPVSFATVNILKDSALLATTVADSLGKYIFNHVPHGKLKLQTSFIGYTANETVFNCNNDTAINVVLADDIKSLEDVTVNSKKPLIERKVDRLVFNVSNFAPATGGTVMDALKLAPGLMVNNSGNLAIVGKSTVKVLMNDRLVQMSGDDLNNFLKSLRANDVQSIEIITAPPAKYDAEGNSGLVNIVMKKTPQNSWNAGLNATYQQGVYAQGTYGGNFNYQKNKLSFYASTSYTGGKDYGKENSQLYYPDLLWNSFSTYKTNTNYSSSTRAGVDYNITKNWTVGAEYIGVFRNSTNLNNSLTNLADTSNNSTAGNIYTILNGKSSSNTNSGNIHSIIKLDTLGRKMNIDFDVLNYTANNDRPYTSTTSNSLSPDVPNGVQGADNSIDRHINNYSLRIDVEHPFKKFSLNYGTKLSFSKTDNNVAGYNTTSGMPVPDPTQTDHFIYNENIQALYFSGNTKFGKNNKWQAQAGLRAENTEFKGNSITTNDVNKKSYLQFFPTAYLNYNLNSKNTFSISYNRRITRPGFASLNPFKYYTSPYYYFQGNPNLTPSYTTNVELNYTYNNSLTSALFYGRSNNGFANVAVLADSNYMQSTQNLNFYTANNAGGYVSYTYQLKWWTSQSAVVFYYQHAASSIYPLTVKVMESYGFQFQTYNSFNLNKKQTLSSGFNFSYQAPSASADMTHNYARFNLDLFFKAQFLKKKLAVTLNGENVLKARMYNNRRTASGNLTYMRGPNNAYFRLTAAYTFGSSKVKVQKRQVGNQDERNRL